MHRLVAFAALMTITPARTDVVLAPAAVLPSFAEPAISPDGKQIAFVSGGALWTVPVEGGEAHLLYASASADARPLFSPDGTRLAFVSLSTGDGDIYVLSIATGRLTRLTYADGAEQLDAWSPDGRWIYFSAWIRDLGAGTRDVYRVRADGGTPMAVTADRYMSEYFAAPSPDGATIAFTARGSAMWWRKGHSHRDESEIWTVRNAAPATYRQITAGGAREQWPIWSPDGGRLYYVSDRGGADNVWIREQSGATRVLTRFNDDRVLWPTISADGRTIAFERDFGIWTLDTWTGETRAVHIVRPPVLSMPAVQHLRLDNQIRELALSPDGGTIAFVAHDEVFVASSRDGSDVHRVTVSPASETQIVWSPDSRRLAYRSDRDGREHIFVYDRDTGAETQLTTGSVSDYSPRFSPHGDELAFVRRGRELRVVRLDTKAGRLLTRGYFGGDVERPNRYEQLLVWSPDARRVAYLPKGGSSSDNPHVVPAAGGESRAVSTLHTNYASNLVWTPDGSSLLFNSGGMGEGESRRLARVTALASDGVRQRVGFLAPGLDVAYLSVSPDGRWALLTASAGGPTNLYLVPLDEREPQTPRQLTATDGAKSYAQFSPDGKEVFFLEQGRIQVVSVDTTHLEPRQPRALPVMLELDVDFAIEKMEIFQQAWRCMDEQLPEAILRSVNWQGIRDRYAPHVAGASNPDELRRLILLMLGELKASHIGINVAGGGMSRTGALGLRFDRSAYERDGSLRISEVVPKGPADLSGGIAVGDRLLAVNGVVVNAGTNLDSLLDGTIGKRTVLTVASSAAASDDSASRTVMVRPVRLTDEMTLRYHAWVEERRALVAHESGGRLGYVHIRNMAGDAIARLYADLDEETRASAGVVIDVRNNSGGVVNGQIIDLLARRDYLTVVERDAPPVSGRWYHNQQALGLPTVLVTNRQSISDAENFTEGYRALHLGPVVGEATAGWDISTGLARLIDGSILNVPAGWILGADGRSLEMHPRPVDHVVTQPVGESYTGKDIQLETAVRVLLRSLRQ